MDGTDNARAYEHRARVVRLIRFAGILVVLLVALLVWARPQTPGGDPRAVAIRFLNGVAAGDRTAAVSVADPANRDFWAGQLDVPITWIEENNATLDHVEDRPDRTFVAILTGNDPVGTEVGCELIAMIAGVDGEWRVVAWSWTVTGIGLTSDPPSTLS